MKQEHAWALVEGISGRSGGIYMDDSGREVLAGRLNDRLKLITADTKRFHVELPVTSDY